MEMIKKTKSHSLNLHEIELFLYKNIANPDTRVWISFDGIKITGFTLAYIVYPAIKPEVFIAWAYMSPRSTLGQDFLNRIEDWAKQIGTSLKMPEIRVSAMVRKSLKMYEEKYGFRLDSYNVIKDLRIEGGK